jgi:hypothetical protein
LFRAQTTKNRFSVNIVLISIFSALWIALNLTIAPISFILTGLPTIHSIIIFFTLILVVWATGQFGAASLVAIIGSPIVLLVNPSILPILGFIPAAVIFDLILIVNHHKINAKPINIGLVVLATIVCGYVAAVVNGLFILNFAPMFTFTFWAAFVVAGAVIAVALSLPIVAVLERAQVKRVKAE